jgi:peptidoglycan hydrolase CwlO-like protein
METLIERRNKLKIMEKEYNLARLQVKELELQEELTQLQENINKLTNEINELKGGR